MARLNFNDEGSAFFDVTLSPRPDALYVVVQMRVHKSGGCSGLLLHAECAFADAASFVRAINAHLAGDATSTALFSYGPMSFDIISRDGIARCAAHCHTDGGVISFHAEVPAEIMRAYLKKLIRIAEASQKGTDAHRDKR